MQRLNSEIKIASEPSDVYKIIVDLEKYDEWNTQIQHLAGQVSEGSRPRVRLKPLYYRSIKSSLRISDMSKSNRLGFMDIRILPFGLLTLDCIFTLSENEDGSTTLHLHQQYQGLFSSLIKDPKRFREAKKSCIKMNAEIKRRSEELHHLDVKEVTPISA
jgi:hypothetical protein